MNNCLTCKYSHYDEIADRYYCAPRLSYIDILLDSEECKTYERSEECE